MKKNRKGGDGDNSSRSRKGTTGNETTKRGSNPSVEEGKNWKSTGSQSEKGRGNQSEKMHGDDNTHA